MLAVQTSETGQFQILTGLCILMAPACARTVTVRLCCSPRRLLLRLVYHSTGQSNELSYGPGLDTAIVKG